jgi:hypothetical protein
VTERPIRRISFDGLRDAIEDVAVAAISDEELVELGIPLDQHEVLLDGLGPSHYTLIELGTGEQYLLHRLDWASPEAGGVHIVTTLTDDAAVLTDRLMRALGLPIERVSWRVPADVWSSMRRGYDADARQAWLKRAGRTAE